MCEILDFYYMAIFYWCQKINQNGRFDKPLSFLYALMNKTKIRTVKISEFIRPQLFLCTIVHSIYWHGGQHEQ